jgi:uncharacterized membrane protein YhiD involved in acid resistance
MFVLIAQMSAHRSGVDPTRITSYAVSGVGFLGAGVIVSDGVSVRGINTAATLWCAAAAGALSASGFIWQAGVATVTVLAINVLLRPLGRRIDRQPIDEDTEIETTYRSHRDPQPGADAARYHHGRHSRGSLKDPQPWHRWRAAAHPLHGALRHCLGKDRARGGPLRPLISTYTCSR